jgi:hypothetical protein
MISDCRSTAATVRSAPPGHGDIVRTLLDRGADHQLEVYDELSDDSPQD